MAEIAAYQCMENGWGKYAHIDMFLAHCVCRGTMLIQSQGPRRVNREHAECFLSIVGHSNAEQRYH